MPYRQDDTGTLSEAAPTPQGGVKAPGILTRPGVFEYKTPNGIVREWRPPEEVFNPESLATLAAAPVTLGHPTEGGVRVKISPANFRTYAVGYLNGPAREDSDKMVAGEVMIQDASAIESVMSLGFRELSCGYDATTDHTAGVTPEGEAYDRIQRNIRYNHVAIVSRGRAGSEVRLRLDSEDNQVTTKDDNTMDPKQLENLISEMAALKAQVTTLEEKLAGQTQQTTDAVKKADEEKARADAAAKAAADATDPVRMDAAIEERVNVLDRVRSVLPTVDPKGKSNRDLRIAALVARDSTFRADGLSDDYVRAYFDATIKPGKPAVGSSADLQRAAAGAASGAGDDKTRTDADDAPNAARARAAMVAESRRMGTLPLGLSKDPPPAR